jgi:NTE family protein
MTDDLRPHAKPGAAHEPTPADELAAEAGTDSGVRRLNLALQGGGSHGAFTWGVLDRLLEDEHLAFHGLSGTSAGALNAAVLATGFHRNGRAGAREALTAFWHDVSRSGSIFAPFGNDSGPSLASALQPWTQMPGYRWADAFFRSFSPYEFNPLNLNPLRQVVERHVDEAALHDCSLGLFITATSVTTGQPRVFTAEDISIDALLASACLPFLFQAVEIDGEPYWDGGYTGNPAMYPLIYNTEVLDILLVRINPLLREGVPRGSMEIMDRLSEITFNASLVGEMRAIQFVSKLVAEGRVDPGHYKALRLHMVADDAGLGPLGPNSKLNTDQAFLKQLFELGRKAATKWLKQHRADIGVRPSLDIEKEFLRLPKPARKARATRKPKGGDA